MSLHFYLLKMGESKLSILVMDIILLVVLLGLTKMIFNTTRVLFLFELLVLGAIFLFTFIALIAVYNDNRWGWKIFSYVFGVILADIMLIYYLRGKPDYFFYTTALALFGFLIALIKSTKKEKVLEAEPVTKEYKPAKFVASKTGKSYHAPKCEWAKKIKKSNHVWFDSEAEAKDDGYKPHSCLDEKVYKNF